MSFKGWMVDKVWYSHTMKYCSVTKGNTLLIHATSWMKFEGVMLNKKSNWRIVTSYVIPFIQHAWIGNITARENRLVVDMTQGQGGWGRREEGGVQKGIRRHLYGDWTALYVDCITVNILGVGLHYSFANCYHWGQLSEDFTGSLCIFSLITAWVHNYFKIKCLITKT